MTEKDHFDISDSGLKAWEEVNRAKFDMDDNDLIKDMLIDEIIMCRVALWNRHNYNFTEEET